jgi:predicted PurR-regulated permease PerM
VVVLTYLAGKLAYRLRDVILMVAVAGFLAVILNSLVVALQRWRIRRRGWAVTVVIVWATLVFIGLLAAFGYEPSGAIGYRPQHPGETAEER